MGTLWQDIRYAMRVLARSPGFTGVVVLILAVGIGVNTAVFSVIHAVLFQALPYDQPDRIVRIWEQDLQHGISQIGSSHQHLVYWREHNHVFEDVSGMQNRRAYVSGLDKSYHVKAMAVSSCFFSLMGARPALGRAFVPEEEQAGKEQVVVLSHGFWRDRLGSAPEAIGRDLVLDGKPYRIVGVMPAGFRHSLRRDVPFWVPLVLDPQSKGGGTGVLARLKPGVTLQQARAQMNILEARLAQMDPQFFSGYTVTVDSFLNDELAGNRTFLHVLWGAVGLVLLVACTNAAGLFLVHGTVRQREMAVRAAVGASRRRIVRQMLTEGLLLSLAAGLLGLLLALGVIKGLVRMCPADIPRMDETGLNLPVLLFALGLSLLTGLLFSLLPAWKTADVALSQTMKGPSTGAAVGRPGRHLRKSLVIAQIGVALTLLMGIGVLIQSLINMQKQDLGIRPQGVLVAHIELPKIKYPSQAQWAAFFEQLLRGVQFLPGVQSAAIVAGGLDLSTGGGFIDFAIDGRPPADPRETPTARAECASADFHQTLGLRVVRGQGFTELDLRRNPRSVIIDETLARRYFPDTDPVGQRINGRTVVGVVATIRDYDELDPSVSTLYLPIEGHHYLVSDLVVRTEGDPLRWSGAIREQVALLDREQEIAEIHTLQKTLADMLAPRQFTTILLAVFAQITLILAAVGLYGIVQYTVTQGTRDLGIRMALGAQRRDVLLAVLRQGLTIALVGVVVGVVGALAATRALASLLYGIHPTDPATLAVVSLVLMGIALLASYLPARRAAGIDPMEALRCE